MGKHKKQAKKKFPANEGVIDMVTLTWDEEQKLIIVEGTYGHLTFTNCRLYNFNKAPFSIKLGAGKMAHSYIGPAPEEPGEPVTPSVHP